MPCPNCGASLEAEARLCPNCGADLQTVWPPPPNITPPVLPLRPKTLTGRVWTDFLLGAAVQYLTHLVTARVLVATVPMTTTSRDWVSQASVPGSFVLCEIFWAFVCGAFLYHDGIRRRYPAIARGSGYATLALLVVLLGAFFTCQPVVY